MTETVKKGCQVWIDHDAARLAESGSERILDDGGVIK